MRRAFGTVLEWTALGALYPLCVQSTAGAVLPDVRIQKLPGRAREGMTTAPEI
jgi:hypothetical protein